MLPMLFSLFFRLRLARQTGYVIIAALFVAAAAVNSSAQYSTQTWNTDNGLPQNTVRAIQQTRDGYLWFGTQDGLVRFDGVRFVTFNTANTKGISSNRSVCLFEDHEGTLWIGTEDGGVIKYQSGSFSSYTTSSGLPGISVLAIRETTERDLLLLTSGGVVRKKG